MKHLPHLVILILAIATTSTTLAKNRYKYAQTGPQTYAKVDEGQVTLVKDGSQPPLDAVQVGMINYDTEDELQLWSKAKQLAAEHGCNYVFIEVKNKRNRYGGNKGVLCLYVLTPESAARILPPPPKFTRGDKVIYMGLREHPATIMAKRDDYRYVVRIDDEGVIKTIPAIKMRKAE